MAQKVNKAYPATKITYTFKKILTGSDLSRRRLPFMAAESGRPGPVVWLTACSHGDEVGGMVVIQEIFKLIRRYGILKNGSLYAFPLMNPIGFEARTRNIPYSQEDLNRCFPGNRNGSVGQRLADLIFTNITETRPALVADLHNDWIKSIPYVLTDREPGAGVDYIHKKTTEFARKTGLVIIRDDEVIAGTLSGTLNRHGIAALTLELGESFVVNEKNIGFGVEAVKNLLAGLDMIMPPVADFLHPAAELYQEQSLLYSARPCASASGILRFLAKPGDIVSRKQPIAKIYNAFGKRQETINSTGNGIILGHTDSSAAFPGMPVMAFGLVDQQIPG